MAFALIGPTRSVAIDSADERILHALPAQFDLRTPECDRLWDAFYADPQVAPDRVTALREEIADIRKAYQHDRGEALAREKNVHTRDPRVRASLVAVLLAGDPVLAKCDELIALCDEAIADGTGLTCSSD